MKKYFAIIALALALVVPVQAASTTVTIAPGGFSNLLSNFRGSANVSSVLLTASSTNIGQVNFVDTYTNSLTYVSPAYSTISSYATNVITTWTNYYGVINSFTNIGLIDYTNSVSASTNAFPIRFQAIANTNSSALYGNQSLYFLNGIWATNTALGTVTATITYTQ